MTIEERGEVRDMIHDILSGWEANTVAREEITNISLVKIDKHLEKINNKVAEHEKTINTNLPHNISHCSQTEIIKTLTDNMITSKTVKKTVYIGFGIIATLVTILWGISEIYFK